MVPVLSVRRAPSEGLWSSSGGDDSGLNTSGPRKYERRLRLVVEHETRPSRMDGGVPAILMASLGPLFVLLSAAIEEEMLLYDRGTSGC